MVKPMAVVQHLINARFRYLTGWFKDLVSHVAPAP